MQQELCFPSASLPLESSLPSYMSLLCLSRSTRCFARCFLSHLSPFSSTFYHFQCPESVEASLRSVGTHRSSTEAPPAANEGQNFELFFPGSWSHSVRGFAFWSDTSGKLVVILAVSSVATLTRSFFFCAS